MTTIWHERRDTQGRLHGQNRPARWTDAGDRQYYRHGKPHRLNGPAIIWADGRREWWERGSLLYIIAADGTETLIRNRPTKPRGGDMWRPKHHRLTESFFREVWKARICQLLTLRDQDRFDKLSLDQIWHKLPHTAASLRREAAAWFGKKHGPRWLRGATIQEMIVLALRGDPRALSLLCERQENGPCE